mmetsp:Transcript_12525/g.29905  ORF Transcript_12525/g.29905 Transcript_12525/m.29905 type:complete len:1255 (+) Transcript_12525:50-3814(+)
MVLVTPSPDGGEISADGTKKKKLTNLEKSDGRRLVEYLVVISSVPRASDEGAGDKAKEEWDLSTSFDDEDVEVIHGFRPQITARYPVEDHSDNPLHENVTFFCHPSGSIHLKKESHMPKIHYFVATGGTGRKMYGTCLTIWEPYIVTGRKKNLGNEDAHENSDHDAFLPKCIVLLSTYPYLMAFREYLTQLNRLTKLGEMTYPLERAIVNICAEIPAPPPGSFEVQTTILDSIIKIWSPPHNQPIAWVSLPFSHLFECLDIDNIVLVWHCLVLERQVLLTSTQLSILTTCSEILLSLLFPMRWSHAYIPVLPHFLIPMLSAPMPFLCGINKASLAEALYDLSRECVVVDLDKNLVTLGPDTDPLPPLPPHQDASLRAQLHDNAGMVFREARSLTKSHDYSESGSHLPPHIKQTAEAMWEGKLCLFDEAFHLMFTPEESRKNLLNGNDTSGMDWSDREHEHFRVVASGEKHRKQSEWDAVQEAFLDTFVYLLRNYRKYLVFPSKHNEGSYGGAGFRSKEFIESQRFDMRGFLEQFIGTQMFDNFITKRLYGSGEADVAFFDLAVDRFLKNSGLLSNVDVGGRLLQATGLASQSDNLRGGMRSITTGFNFKKDVEPLLQSARVHRKLKTIVPPEPCMEDLPPIEHMDNVVAVSEPQAPDDASLGSASTSSRSQANNDAYKSVQDKAAEILGKQKLRYSYDVFPSEFREELFAPPRPLPAAVIAEFDRQKKDAAQFRRKKSVLQPSDKRKHIQRAHTTLDPETPPSPEVGTFTVFFMAFTAMIGKELLELDYASDKPGKTILSTYVPTRFNETGGDSTTSDTGTTGEDEESFKDVVSAEEQEGVADMKSSRPSFGAMIGEDSEKRISTGSDQPENPGGEETPDSAPKGPTEEKKTERPDSSTLTVSKSTQPRRRFRDSLSALQIEEAKATGRAQLGLAFEMLTMMKKRALKADPEAYQCLIDACGRVGDTNRATDLLAKMHEDGIVADGTVYACLVSAFSAETAWKKGTKEEDLPEWANSTAVEMDWNRLQKRTLLDRLRGINDGDPEDEVNEHDAVGVSLQKIRNFISRKQDKKRSVPNVEESRVEFFVTEGVERQIELGENLLEIVFPDISVDTDNETCPRCNFLLSDDDVVGGWTPGDSNDYTTSCPNCSQRFVPHFCVQSSSPYFVGSRGPSSPLMCERLSPWVLQKEIRSVMSDREGIENLLSPEWRDQEYKNAVLWWNLVLSCMRYRFPFSFLLQGSFEQNLIAPMPEDDH